MFIVHHQYRGPIGNIRHSRATPSSHFQNSTKGLALKYVIGGREDYLVRGQELQVSGGQFILLRQDQSFEAIARAKRQLTDGLCIDLDSDTILRHIPELYEQELLFGLPIQGQHSLPLHQRMHQVAKQALQPASATDWSALLGQITDELQRFSEEVQRIQPLLATKAKKVSTQKALLGKLLNARDFIHQHYRRSLTLKILARQAGISEYYFSRLFQACFQQSPSALQTQLRMQASLTSMQHEHLSLSDIAFQLGYSDLAAFSNQFKQFFQQSPSEYRARLISD